MSKTPTEEEVRASIKPKSDQLNADDLLTGPITVTITDVRKGDKDQPIVVEIDGGHQPYKPCKTCRRILISQFSDDPKKWVGQKMTLYNDPSVTWAGMRVGGVRISHLSGMDKPKTFLLTQTRGKKAEVTIEPLPTPKPELSRAEWFRGWLGKKELPEADAIAQIGGRTLEEATDEDWATLKVWMKQFTKGTP